MAVPEYQRRSSSSSSSEVEEDSNVPAWARGVVDYKEEEQDGPTSSSTSSDDEEGNFKSVLRGEFEDLTITDLGDRKRMIIAFCRDRRDIFDSAVTEAQLYQLLDWPIPKPLASRNSYLRCSRLRQSFSEWITTHWRGKCTSLNGSTKIQAVNPTLHLPYLMRIIMSLSYIEEPDQFRDLPPKKVASSVLRSIMEKAILPKDPNYREPEAPKPVPRAPTGESKFAVREKIKAIEERNRKTHLLRYEGGVGRTDGTISTWNPDTRGRAAWFT